MCPGRGHRKLIAASLAAVLLWPCGGLAAELSVMPAEVIPGGIVRVRLRGACDRPEGSVGGEDLRFFQTGSEGPIVSLFGVDLDAPAGKRTVAVRCDGWTQQAAFSVRSHEFPKQELTVSDRYVRPSPADQARAAKEARRLRQLWGTASSKRLWQGRFQRPADGALGSAFGLRRFFNGQPRAPHSGVDIRARKGAPVAAANAGRVVLRDELFFSGKTLVLDHGLGLYTAYLHLSEYRVSEGDLVSKGQVIGEVGATGRVTGPHLHFSARLGGARVEPWQLISDDLDGFASDGTSVEAGEQAGRQSRAEAGN